MFLMDYKLENCFGTTWHGCEEAKKIKVPTLYGFREIVDRKSRFSVFFSSSSTTSSTSSSRPFLCDTYSPNAKRYDVR